MKKRIKKSDFSFIPVSYGRYEVTYTSPATGKKWTAQITDMGMIDNTKNETEPKVKNLEDLKRHCKLNSKKR